jgi:hypothetical protein
MSIGKFLKFKEKFELHKQQKTEVAALSLSLKKTYDSVSAPAPKKLRNITSFCSNVNLTSLLEKSDNGMIVLKNKKELGNDHRQIMCRIIVDHFVSNGITMGKTEFRTMSEKIMAAFPTESNISIYYVEPEGKSRKAKGKLPDRFFNFTRLLKKHNILESARTGSVAISKDLFNFIKAFLRRNYIF